MTYKCPCCGNYTFRDPPDISIAYICPVCCWENDVFITADDEPSDENGGITLVDAKKNYKAYGASRKKLLRMVRSPTPEEIAANES